MSEVLICPVCGKPLKKTEKSFICEKGHVFDIAKEGYVNLLTGNRAGGGDKAKLSRRRLLQMPA